jgi:hypothetical protein
MKKHLKQPTRAASQLYHACLDLLHSCAENDEDFFNRNRGEISLMVKAVDAFEEAICDCVEDLHSFLHPAHKPTSF